ncbi:MAG TPA: alanine racemase [Noviherbaspirillum sp.]|jgi:alanine racemase|uniref:alanine racemase n=1 Tax=Noviherbaspirillum sp. TaxID=1926288 RepID=UPI002DDD7547|nr:alanine racemase [Noviherbaspirillum sp.]HEV2612135.1 alanine racemase [Noviherbaspirillum sp.]
MPRPLVATIDIAAMRHNLEVARLRAPRSKIWAVVKANAYGHGLDRGMRAFSAADGLGLIEVDGAVRLRDAGWQKPILLLEGFFESADLLVVDQYQLQVAVHCNEQIEMIERANFQSPLHVHLKMNSGMNRLGFKPDVYRQAYERLRANRHVGSITLMTHFANADDSHNPGMSLEQQVRRFVDASEELAGDRSLSNSAATLIHSQVSADWIRPGIMLYGGTPGGGTAEDFGLRAAMTLTSELIGIQRIVPGDSVGYGSRFVADREMTIGIVACGYADGYPRHAPNGTPVIVEGHRTVIVGRVSMDMISVDITSIPSARVGSKVTLWGGGLPIDEVANAAGTIGYELMCALAPRVRVEER